ncbi:TVP38/TMEM64 family protein [Legionella brunensis]|uniref:TVP38/TMEM64 family membrane protein n=1 Tax=Legionella brunensis TaxID=29422 RepID=A0A0W0SNF1_9GAMM|nr:TVP38/TMEM64 family protein [Legionella brunensis]KTC84501.1 hypothetical protein Lbru_1369 [Legionella brunensis]
MKKISLGRFIPLLILVILLVLFFYFRLDSYLTFDALQQHRTLLLAWTKEHYLLMMLSFMAIYSLAVAISIPGAVFLTLTGGFLFGIVWGTIYVVFSATIGATLLFFAVRTALHDWLSRRNEIWVAKMREGFRKNSFSYLLILRLVPLFPFWIVNIVPGLLNVKTKTFILATFIGIIPGSLIYVMVGNGLGHVFDKNEKPDLAIIFTPEIILPLIGLALLTLIPVIYRWSSKDNHERKS